MYDSLETYKKLQKLREYYIKDLNDIQNPDYLTALIIKSKVVAINQVLELLGYEKLEKE